MMTAMTMKMSLTTIITISIKSMMMTMIIMITIKMISDREMSTMIDYR